MSDRFKTWHRRLLLILLFCIAILINNHWRGDWSPNTSDEHFYTGVARQLVLFQNRPLTFSFGEASLIFPYFVGLISLLTTLDTEILFHVFHHLFLLGILVSFYRLGAFFKPSLGLLMAAFVTFYHAPSFYIGLWTMVPSLFIFLILPNICLHLVREEWRFVILWLIITFFLYAWALPPFLVFIGFYWFIRKSKARWGYLLAFILIAYLTIRIVGNDLIFQLFPQTISPAWYGGAFIKLIEFYIFALVGLVMILRSKNADPPKLFHFASLGVSMISTNLIFWLTVSTYAHIRTVIFLWVGLFILTSLFWLKVKRFLPRLSVVILFMIFFTQLMSTTTYTNTRDAFSGGGGGVTILESERNAMDWLAAQGDNIFVLSDYPTLLMLDYYFESANSRAEFFYNEGTADLHMQITSDYTFDVSAIYTLLTKIEFSESDFSFLEQTARYTGSDRFYFLISSRTREEMAYFLNHRSIHAKRLVDNTTSPPFFRGEVKFSDHERFKQVFEDNELLIYELSL